MTVKELKEKLDLMVETSNGVFSENTPITIGVENCFPAFSLRIGPEQEYLREDGINESEHEFNHIDVVGLGTYSVGIILKSYPLK